jgi:hypothetical protein
VTTYTSCRDCGRILESTDGQTVHADCDAKPTEIELAALRMNQAWAAGDDERQEREFEEILMLKFADVDDPRLSEFAVFYARIGWPVFPLKPWTKVPATRDGFKSATTDIAKIKHIWAQNPAYNIGLPTGLLFDVIDVDLSGFEVLDALEESGALDSVHGHVATASGGAHYYIPATGAGCTVGMLTGIDYRGIGGYVVAPPSRTGDPLGEDTDFWSWVSSPSPRITAIEK